MTIPGNPRTREQTVHRTVLLVEDEHFLREAMSLLLQSAGYEVLSAADAQGALSVYKQNRDRIDVVISDLELPGRSGRLLGQDLRQSSPTMPILLTSGYLASDCEEQSVDKNMYFLPKPYSIAQLVEKLEQIFHTMPLQRAAAG